MRKIILVCVMLILLPSQVYGAHKVDGEFYTITQAPTASIDEIINPVPEDAMIELPDGEGWYVHTKDSDDKISSAGPFSQDTTAPVINMYYVDSLAYVISDVNLDMTRTGYYVGDTPYAGEHLESLADSQGVINHRGLPYIYIKAYDHYDNTSDKEFRLDTRSPVAFVFDPVYSRVELQMATTIDFSRSSYRIVSAHKTYEWVSLASSKQMVYFPSTGKYTIEVNAIFHGGSSYVVKSNSYTVNYIDSVAPSIHTNITPYGVMFVFSDSGTGVDLSRSSIVSLGKLHTPARKSFEIRYSEPSIEFVRVILYDFAGNKSERVLLSKYLNSSKRVDLQYNLNHFEVFAEDYTAPAGLKSGLYTHIAEPQTLTDSAGNTVFVHVGSSTPRQVVNFDLSNPSNVKISTDEDITLAYYILNKQQVKHKLTALTVIDRSELEKDINQIVVYLKTSDGYVSYPSPMFEREPSVVDAVLGNIEQLLYLLEGGE